jgi:hypothetical protein
LKDDHLLVSAEDGGAYRVAAIDFAAAFAWPAGGGNVDGPTTEPKGLVENVDKAAVEATVQRIEGVSDGEIRQIVASIPENVLPTADRDRVTDGLIARRGSIGNAMKNRGWLP